MTKNEKEAKEKKLVFPSAKIGIEEEFLPSFGTHIELYGLSDRQFGGDFSESFNGLPGYTILNWNNTITVDNFRLSFRINNLLDTKYSDSGIIAFDFRNPFPSPQVETFYPSPGRNYMLSLQYNYQ